MFGRISEHRTTEPAVRKLLELIKSRKRGEIVTYAEIEECAGAKRGDGHFRAVCISLKKHLRKETDMVLIAVLNQGYRIPTNTDQASHGLTGVRQSLRQAIRKTEDVAVTVDSELPEDLRAKKRHLLSNCKLLEQMSAQMKRLPAPTLKASATGPKLSAG